MQSSKEEELIKETNRLMAMPEEDRINYVKSVLNSLGDALRQIINEPARLKQAKMSKQLLEELNGKAEVLLPPVIYVIKEEFQPTIIQLMQSLATQDS